MESLNLQNTGIGRNWNRNHVMLESESESESKFLVNTGIRIGITYYRNRNWNRNHGFWKTLESESESESALAELELESLVPESFTTLTYMQILVTRWSKYCPKPSMSSKYLTTNQKKWCRLNTINIDHLLI